MSQIAFVGLGVMGRPMAENLLADGNELVVASRGPGPVEALEAAGARGAATPAEAVRGAEVAITMLPDGEAVAAVTGGEDPAGRRRARDAADRDEHDRAGAGAGAGGPGRRARRRGPRCAGLRR